MRRNIREPLKVSILEQLLSNEHKTKQFAKVLYAFKIHIKTIPRGGSI